MPQLAAVQLVSLEVHVVGASPEALQGLQEGFSCFLLFSRGQPFFFHLLDLIKGNRLSLESTLPGSSQLAFTSQGSGLNGLWVFLYGTRVMWQGRMVSRAHSQ
ncbi:hypothetical protein GDO78_013976 [Eleutherodactylus coqui]|uniref:Uncharacterized protein n=1 Tax=Eleutherodactylus coqui TaxID=57060 RepID=A0A8J6EF10_ELECQ|nr:hypothetical protein GDO78_013976 [Eleutherodactylus coqui]